MKKFCESLREHALKIINFKNKKNEIIKKRAPGIIWKIQKSVKFVMKNLKINIWKTKNIAKLEIIVIIQGNIEVLRMPCNLKYNVPKKIPIAFHN